MLKELYGDLNGKRSARDECQVDYSFLHTAVGQGMPLCKGMEFLIRVGARHRRYRRHGNTHGNTHGNKHGKSTFPQKYGSPEASLWRRIVVTTPTP